MTSAEGGPQAGLRALLRPAAVIPVLVVEDAELAVALAEALVAGGLPVLEFTLRTPAALQAVQRVAVHVPGAIVGTGTVRSPDDLLRSADAGAVFAVSPGLSPRLAEAAERSPIPLLPGVSTASEAMSAAERGFCTLKLFPAVPVGGVALLRALGGPLPELRFCPTGGVSLKNAPEFLALPNVICVGGSWVAPAEALAAGDWAQVRALAAQAAALRPDPQPLPDLSAR